MAAKVVGFVKQKGGVGNTTLALNVAFECAIEGKRTLVIDADPQQSLNIGWLEDRAGFPLPDLLKIEPMCTKEIHKVIDSSAEGYDLVIIDGPPRSTDITRSIMLASDLIVIPCTPSGLDVKASKITLIAAYKAKRDYSNKLKIVFAINRKPANTVLGKGLRESLLEMGDGIVVLNADVHMRTAFAEAMSMGFSIQELHTDFKARIEIKNLYTEIMRVLYENSEN